MKKSYIFYFVMLMLALASLVYAHEAEAVAHRFCDGDTIVYLGDSITHGGTYHSFINLFYLTRFPNANINMVNAGVAGNQAFHAIDRFEDDVMIHHPNIIVLMLGMNDAGVYSIQQNDTQAEKRAKLLQQIETYNDPGS